MTKKPTPPPPLAEPILSRADLLRLTADPEKFFLANLPHHCRSDFNVMHQFSFQQYQRQHA